MKQVGSISYRFFIITIIFYINYSKTQPIGHLQNQSKIKNTNFRIKEKNVYFLIISSNKPQVDPSSVKGFRYTSNQ